MATVINSEDKIPIDCHFKVMAGPGAGKTHWLINHVKNVLAHSDRLGKCGKIACVTYTNTGVETIAHRIGASTKAVEVCTIHSFFYNHIVKPYLHFIAEEEGFNMDLLKGADDRFDLSYPTLEAIKKQTRQNYVEDKCLADAIRSAKWRFDEHGDLVCKPEYPKIAKFGRRTYLSLKTYPAYKNLAWSEGLMQYDDVIYFAYRIFERIPFAQEVIARKFPYMFVDEFQDSHPIQVEIIKKIADHGSIIGVIGDPAQSIYQFLGAEVEQFNAFALSGIKEYVIDGNWRSTAKIVSFLNVIRKDLQQIAHREKEGDAPLLLIGSHIDNYNKLMEMTGGNVYALAYDNLSANSLKKMMSVNIVDRHLIDKIPDSNEERKYTVSTFVKALEHANAGNFKKAFELLGKIDIDIKDAVVMIQKLLSNYDSFKDKSLFEFYKYLNDTFGLGMTAMREGKGKTFYDGHQYLELAMSVNYEDDTGLQRTIHRAKGDEFDNVMVCLGDEDALEFFLHPDLQKKEAHRVYYVAASRAKEKLFFSIPTLSDEKRKELENIGLKINWSLKI